jgi:hypothetical protein
LSQILSHLIQTILILQNLNQVTVRVKTILDYLSHSTQEHRLQQKHANCIDVPGPKQERKKLINQIQNRNKSKKTNQTNFIFIFLVVLVRIFLLSMLSSPMGDMFRCGEFLRSVLLLHSNVIFVDA